MPLRNSQYEAIMRDYNRKQLNSRHLQDAHIAEAYEKLPRLTEIDREIAALSLKKARILLGESSHPSFDLPLAIAELSEERQAVLASGGYPADYLEPHYECSLCKDTGYIASEKCSCFKKAATQLLYTQSNLQGILEEENFSHFSLDYYSDSLINQATGQSARQTARQAVEKSWDFINTFGSTFSNLFLYGDTGVGKTFLSHCISRELIERSYCVLYFSAFDLFDSLAKTTFRKENNEENSTQYIFDCDLLIIDDLGTELTNSFVSSQLFLCINERIIRKKSTIISTNLSIEQFLDTYSERTFSRISSNYAMIKLIGKDIRIQKKLSGGK